MDFGISDSLERAFNSIDVAGEVKHIKMDTLEDALQHLYRAFNAGRKKSFSIPEGQGSYSAVVSVGAEDMKCPLEFKDGKKFILTTNMSEMKTLTKQQRMEVLEIMNVISDGTPFYENIRRYLTMPSVQ